MNRKNRYFVVTNYAELDNFELFMVYHNHHFAGRLWAKVQDSILQVWTKIFPGTRPRIWWERNHPKEYCKLREDAREGVFQLSPSPEAQKETLSRLGELQGLEADLAPKQPDYRVFVDNYKKLFANR